MPGVDFFSRNPPHHCPPALPRPALRLQLLGELLLDRANVKIMMQVGAGRLGWG